MVISSARVVVLATTLICSIAYAAQEDWQRVDSIPADVKSISVAMPIYGQVVAFGLPKGWKAGFEKAQQSMYIIEFVPADQSVQNWRDMYTVQGFRGLALNPQLTPKRFSELVSERYQKTCPEKPVIQSIGETTIDSRPAYAAILGCGAEPADRAYGLKKGQGEVAYFLFVQGAQDFYMFHRARRTEGFEPAESPIKPENVSELVRDFEPIRLCEKTVSIAECAERRSK